MTASINYPSSLPAWQRDGYGYSLADLASRTDFPLGARQRQLYTDGIDVFSASVILTAAQLAYFKGFWRYTLKAGTQWLNLPLLYDGSVQTVEARFVCNVQPKPQLVGVNSWQYTLSIETRQGTTIDEGIWDLIDETGISRVSAALLQALSDMANTNYGYGA